MKFEFGDLYKFIVSLGVVLITYLFWLLGCFLGSLSIYSDQNQR